MWMMSLWNYPSSDIADDDHAPVEVPAGQDLNINKDSTEWILG